MDERNPTEKAEKDAVVPRQDATGMDVPAGASAADVRSEDERPIIDTGDGPPDRPGP